LSCVVSRRSKPIERSSMGPAFGLASRSDPVRQPRPSAQPGSRGPRASRRSRGRRSSSLRLLAGGYAAEPSAAVGVPPAARAANVSRQTAPSGSVGTASSVRTGCRTAPPDPTRSSEGSPARWRAGSSGCAAHPSSRIVATPRLAVRRRLPVRPASVPFSEATRSCPPNGGTCRHASERPQPVEAGRRERRTPREEAAGGPAASGLAASRG